MQGFHSRTSEFQAALCHAVDEWFDVAGNWLLPVDAKPPGRELLWLACGLIRGGATARANAILRAPISAHAQRPDASSRFDIFNSNIAVVMLRLFADKLEPGVASQLREIMYAGFGNKPGNRQPDYQFHGYNDNMPAKATMGLILGGEMTNQPDAVAYGLWNLRNIADMLSRRGVISEFNSPTYSALTIHAIAEIAEHARNEEARHLALDIEHRLWIDLASRYHTEAGVMAGPYQRAYAIDRTAGLSCVAGLLWFAFGDAISKNSPMSLFAPESLADTPLHFHGRVVDNVAQHCWWSIGCYHIPDVAIDLFQHKTPPHRSTATFEMGDRGPDHPSGSGHIQTYIEPDYSIGVSSTEGSNFTQSAHYVVTYRQCDPVKSRRDIGTVYSQFVVDDETPGQILEPTAALDESTPGRRWLMPTIADSIEDPSHRLSFESDRAVMVLSNPVPGLGESDGEPTFIGNCTRPRDLKRLSELVVFPSLYRDADELIVGGERRDSWAGVVKRGDWVVCRRGRLLIGVRPMAFRVDHSMPEITLESERGFQYIRTTLYQGEPRRFSRTQLRHMFAGFVAEHANTDEYSSLKAFADTLEQGQFTDYYWCTRRARYRRQASEARNALDLEVSMTPGQPQPRYATVNRVLIRQPMVEIDGVDRHALPLVGGEPVSKPGFFPWTDFENAWYEVSWGIGDRETPDRDDHKRRSTHSSESITPS